MPEVGDFVTYYTHENMDSAHNTIDAPALVTGVYNDDSGRLDLTVFPRGAQPYFVTGVGQFDTEHDPEQDGPLQVGLSYWREMESDPPDFGSVYDRQQEVQHNRAREQAKADLESKHRNELAAMAQSNPDALKERQQREWDDFNRRFGTDEDPQGEAQPETGLLP
jgi:hypothetical protein